MKNKRVIFVIFTLQGNGAERVVLTLAGAMHKLGHDVSIVCFKDHIEYEVETEIPLYFFPYQKFRIIPKFVRSFFAAKAFDRFVADNFGQVDLVFSNLEQVDFVLTESKMKNIHFIIHNTISQAHKSNHAMQTKVLDAYRGKSCISVSNGVDRDLNTLLDNVNSRTIYNPIDVEFIQKSAKLELDGDVDFGEYIINVGGFKHAKRHDRLLRAFAESNLSCNLVLVGKGALLDETRQLAAKLGISDRVIFAGFFPNPFPIIKSAKAMVVSSDFEGLGMTILEAICLGVPVISTNCPSGPGEILPELNLSPVDDEDVLAKKMSDVFHNPDKFRIDLNEAFLVENGVKNYLLLAQ